MSFISWIIFSLFFQLIDIHLWLQLSGIWRHQWAEDWHGSASPQDEWYAKYDGSMHGHATRVAAFNSSRAFRCFKPVNLFKSASSTFVLCFLCVISLTMEITFSFCFFTDSSEDCRIHDESQWDHVRRGICCLCQDSKIDSLLYRYAKSTYLYIIPE